MGLFSRKKKVSREASAEADAAAAAASAAAIKAEQDRALKARLDAEATAKKRAADEARRKDEKTLADITTKRKEIKELEKAMQRFEDERNEAMRSAVKAKGLKRDTEMKSHLRNATRLKNRIAQYQNQVNLAQQMLDALEDAAMQRQNLDSTTAFVDNLNEIKIDSETVENKLQDMREVIQGVNEVNLTVQADAELNKNAYDLDEAMDELDALEAEIGQEATQSIPNVPDKAPVMPTIPAGAPAAAASSSISASEEEEMRRLEADIAI